MNQNPLRDQGAGNGGLCHGDLVRERAAAAARSTGNGNHGNGNGGHAGSTAETRAQATAVRTARETARASQYRLKCPECEGDLDTGEGCIKCHGCGFSQG